MAGGKALEADPVFPAGRSQSPKLPEDRRLLATVLSGLGATLVDRAEYGFEPSRFFAAAWHSLTQPVTARNSLESAEALNNLAMLYRHIGDMARACTATNWRCCVAP